MRWGIRRTKDSTFFVLIGVGFIILLFSWCAIWWKHSSARASGEVWEVIELGTCIYGTCGVRVKSDNGDVQIKSTKSRVFVGDIVTCGLDQCYKD